MAAVVIHPLPRAGYLARVLARLRGLSVPRLLNRLAGVDSVVLEGRVFAVRARPIAVCRTLVPAILRCSKRFSSWDIDERLYDDLVLVLSLGLAVKPSVIEQLTVPPWSLAPVIEQIAIANGLPVVEAGRADLGELLKALTSTGTSSALSSSAQQDGPQTTSTTS